jgi:hypothetical protein
MKIVKFLLFFLMPVSWLSLPVEAKTIRESAEAEIAARLADTVSLAFSRYLVPPDIKPAIEKQAGQRFYRDFVYTWQVAGADGATAYAVLDNCMGKVQPITFMVIFARQGDVLSVSIVRYRESFGGEVQNRKWLDQFRGLDAAASFKVGSDIDGVSGATISANAVARGVKRLSLLIPHLLPAPAPPPHRAAQQENEDPYP